MESHLYSFPGNIHLTRARSKPQIHENPVNSFHLVLFDFLLDSLGFVDLISETQGSLLCSCPPLLGEKFIGT